MAGHLVPDIVIVFEVDGEPKRLDYRRLPFSAWSELKRELDFSPKQLLAAVPDHDLEAFGAIIWLERKQHKRDLRWSAVRRELETRLGDLEFEILDLIVDGVSEFTEEEEAEEEAGEEEAGEEEADPMTAGN